MDAFMDLLLGEFSSGDVLTAYTFFYYFARFVALGLIFEFFGVMVGHLSNARNL